MKKILLSGAVCVALAYGDVAVLLPVEKRTFDQSKFIPNISVILDTSYVSRNIDKDTVQHLEVPGVAHGLLGTHNHGDVHHATYNAKEGFNLNYAELVLSSTVDPFLTMDAVFHFSENGVEVEEAYFTSTALGNGLRARGGKLLSNFGYINAQHHHYWDFGDMPLVYEAFLGMHGIKELGGQLQWTLPTPFYSMIGVEILQGDNKNMFGNSTIGHTESAIAKGKQAPSLYVGYIKSSYDIGNTTIFGGLSYAQGESRIDHSEEEENPHAFSGDAKLFGADLVVMHQIDSYKSIKWQSEMLSRKLDGVQYNLNTGGDVLSSPSMLKKQSGLYSQLIYKHDNNWKAGIRYDTIFKNDVQANAINQNKPNDLNRYSAMIEYHTSEFARFRLQFNRDYSLYNEDAQRQKMDSIMLQANISIGAHAAHSF